MRALHRFWRRLKGTLSGAHQDEEFAAEIEAHLQMQIDDNLRLGMPPDAARRAAALKFGSVESARERWREQRVLPLLDTLPREVRFAVRGLVRRPVFTAVCVMTLALAIGATVTVFSLIDRVLLHPLDVPDPSSLVTVQRTFTARDVQSRQLSMTWENAMGVRDGATLESLALSSASTDRASRRLALSIDGSQPAGTVEGRFVTASYFRVLGIAPAAGRDFTRDDDTAAAPPVVILSHRFWRARFGGDVNAVGLTVRVNDVPTIIIGVAPQTFTGTELGVAPPDVFLPLMTGPRLATNTGSQTDGRGRFFSGGFGGERSAISPIASLTVIGRVTPGSARRIDADLAALFGSDEWAVVPLAETMLPFDSRADLRRFLGLLGGAVALTFLIGCANLCGLLLARAEERRSELAVRAALGAGRARLVRELAIEAILLAAAGGAAAFLVTRWLEQGLSAFVLPGGILLSSLRDGVDTRTLVFAMFSTVAAAITIGLGPAVRAASRHLALDMKGHGGGLPRIGGTRLLVAVQVTVCVVLVFGAALFIRSVSNALATDLGFDARGLISASMSVPVPMSVTPTSGFHGYHATNQVIERVREMPGVSAVTAGPLPLVKGSDGSTNAVIVDGMPVELSTPAEVIYTASDYFTTLRQPLVRGRDFAASDRQGTRPVAIVNEAAARQLWPGGDPLEHQIGFPPRGAPVVGGIDFAVVGIVRDAKIRQLSETGRPVVYLARLQHESYLAGMIAGSGNSFLIVRATGNPAALAPALARIGEDAGLPLQAMTTVEQGVNEILMPQRLGRALLMLLGTLALTLTAVGIYGFVSYLVARNTKEIGIRMALGARTRVIVRAVLAGTLAPVAAGVVTGSVLAWFAGHFADRFMYGIQGADPATVAIAIAAILVSGMLAVLLPTRRALRINPIETLRGD